MPEIAERSTDIGIAQSTVRNGALSDRCTEQAATLDEKLNVATAVNHSLTEYAQFVNQSEIPEHRTGAVSSFIAKAADEVEPPYAADRFRPGLRGAR